MSCQQSLLLRIIGRRRWWEIGLVCEHAVAALIFAWRNGLCAYCVTVLCAFQSNSSYKGRGGIFWRKREWIKACTSWTENLQANLPRRACRRKASQNAVLDSLFYIPEGTDCIKPINLRLGGIRGVIQLKPKTGANIPVVCCGAVPVLIYCRPGHTIEPYISVKNTLGMRNYQTVTIEGQIPLRHTAFGCETRILRRLWRKHCRFCLNISAIKHFYSGSSEAKRWSCVFGKNRTFCVS